MNNELTKMIETAKSEMSNKNIHTVRNSEYIVTVQRTQGRIGKGGIVRVDVYSAVTGKRVKL